MSWKYILLGLAILFVNATEETATDSIITPSEGLDESQIKIEEGDNLPEGENVNMDNIESLLGEHGETFKIMKSIGCYTIMQRRLSEETQLLSKLKELGASGSNLFLKVSTRTFQHCLDNVPAQDQMSIINPENDKAKEIYERLKLSPIEEIIKESEEVSETEKETFKTLQKVEEKIQEFRGEGKNAQQKKRLSESGFAENDFDTQDDDEDYEREEKPAKAPVASQNKGFSAPVVLAIMAFFVGLFYLLWIKLFTEEVPEPSRKQDKKEKLKAK